MSWGLRLVKIKRTSAKTFAVGLTLVILGVFAMDAADGYIVDPKHISFGVDMGRPWNIFDIVWVSSFVLAAALFVVSLLFLSKDD